MVRRIDAAEVEGVFGTPLMRVGPFDDVFGLVDRTVGAPTMSAFYGVVIRMFWLDHAPPHFHASYAEDEASIDIRTLTVVRGALPLRALARILEWAALHREELLQDWDLCATKQSPRKIPPLV